MIQVSKSVSRPSYIYISRPSYIFGFRILARWTAVIQIVPVYMCVYTAVGLLFLTDLIIYKLRLLLIPLETTTANRQSTHIVRLDACFLTVMGLDAKGREILQQLKQKIYKLFHRWLSLEAEVTNDGPAKYSRHEINGSRPTCKINSKGCISGGFTRSSGNRLLRSRT